MNDGVIATATVAAGFNVAQGTFIRIRPTPGWRALDIAELWRFRELWCFLVWRDLKVRYKQTVLGAAWAVIQPLFSMVVFSVFFGKLAAMPSDGIPYPIFSYAALLPWTYFANALTSAGNSLLGNANLITKVYFPRLIIPASAVIAGLVDFAISFAVFLLLMLGYQLSGENLTPSPAAIVAVPLLTVLVSAIALGIGLLLSALNVHYRDFRYVVPFLVQLGMFATPIVYPLSLVPEKYRWLVALNPMTGVIEGFRSALLGSKWDFVALGLSVLAAVVLLASGAYYFRRVERTFADVV